MSPPGSTAYVRRASATPIEEDLALIDADPGVRQEFQAIANQRRRQMLEFRRLLKELDGHRQSGESLRAAAIAYTIDYHHVRSRWEAARQLERTFDDAIAHPSQPAAGHEGSNWSLRTLWCRWRYGGRINRLLQQPAFAGYDALQRKVCRRLLCRRRGPLLDALCRLTRDPTLADPLDDARKVLRAVARDPATWSRQLVILRAVQTLSVLDLKTYCDLVHELGEYDPCALDAADGMVASEEERMDRV